MDVERTMQFILEQQAQFASDIQVIKEVIKAQQDELSQVNSILRELATAQERTIAVVETLAERHMELADQQRATEQNLNALISTVDRHIASHT